MVDALCLKEVKCPEYLRKKNINVLTRNFLFIIVGRTFRNQANAQGQEDIITHPLLSNSTGGQLSGGNAARSMIDEAFSRRLHHHGPPGLSNWQDFEDIIGGSAVRMLEDLLTHAPSASQAGPLRVDVQAGPGGVLRTFEFDRLPPLGVIGHTHHHHPITPTTGTGNNDQTQESLAILHDFQPMSSGERWNQEARMMYGANLSEKALKLVSGLLNILVPIAIEDDKKARAEEEKKRQEQRRKDEEARRKAEEERWRIEKEQRKAAQEAAANAAPPAPQQETATTSSAAPVEASNNEAATAEIGADTQASADAPTTTEAATNADAPSGSAESERTTVTIHGLPVDISGTGIDVEFLEALPDDLREEVLNQHLRNRPTPSQPVEDDSISPEFLDALPPDIREEVLHQEAIERGRRDRQNRQAPTNTPVTNTPNTVPNTAVNTATPSGNVSILTHNLIACVN